LKLSVVILNYNVRYFLELCLKSVEAALTHIDSEILVVDNHSSDTSCKMVAELFPNVQLIENKDNSGFSKGNNIGVAQATGEYVCILNPDTVVAEDSFTKLLALADTKQDLGILGCKLIDGSGNYLPESKRNIPTPSISFKKIFGFMLLKREVYNVVNGFDEDYFMYGEDIDLSYRILKAGYTNYYTAETTSIHFKGESTPKDTIYVKRFYNAMRIFYKKHFKKNIVFDSAVSLGVRIIPVFNKLRRVDSTEPSDLKEIIFDNANLSYKSIIESFQNKKGKFKIRPKNSNFIIGSSNSKSQGDVELIK